MRRRISLAAVALAASWVYAASAQQPQDGPKYVSGTNNLIRPDNYREWIFIGSSLGLNYPPPGQTGGPQMFHNVYVNPSSYRSFMQTGKWPDKTVYILEMRGVGTERTANRDGKFETGLMGFEANVKDSRFPDGWGYFGFGDNDKSVAPLSGDRVKGCIDCHTAHTAVERTFVQFYPTLFEVAKQKGTVKKDYTDP
jgi:cytochrome P460